MAKETEYFLFGQEKITEEDANKKYASVDGNGGIESGDGYLYRGRGGLQITRKNGYRRYGEFIGDETSFVKSPDELLKKEHVIRSSGWFWQHGKLANSGNTIPLNLKADLGNFKRICVLIQGSDITFSERHEMLIKVKNVIYQNGKCYSENDLTDNIIDFHIYADGRIEKHLPKEESFQAKYYYHDSKNSKHFLGCVELINIKNVYGDTYGGDKINMVDMRIINMFRNGNLNFKLSYDTTRFFLNEKTLASLLGAMINSSFEDFVCHGFSKVDGSSGKSKSHKNGYNGDLRYLSKNLNGERIHLDHELFDKNDKANGWSELDKIRQNKFNDSLYLFGWKSMLSYKFEAIELNHCTHDSEHFDHLHIQGYKPNYIEKVK